MDRAQTGRAAHGAGTPRHTPVPLHHRGGPAPDVAVPRPDAAAHGDLALGVGAEDAQAGPQPQPPECARQRLDAYAATVTCVYCGVGPGLVRAEWRPKWVTRPFTAQALAGVQVKTTARLLAWPWLICGHCGHESEGKQ